MKKKPQHHVVLDGRLLPASRALVSPLGEGFLYGMGLFETVKVARGRALFLADHAARLRRAAAALGLRPPLPLRTLASRCARLIAAEALSSGVLKVVLFEGVDGPSELVLTRPGGYAPAVYARGFRLAVAADARPAGPLCRFKTLNYLGNILARRRSMAAGADEVIFVDRDGRVTEGAGTSIFAVEGGRVVTPPLSAGILPGTARARVMRLLGPRRLSTRPLPLSRLLKADEIFVTNAILGVMPVSRVGGRRLDLSRNPVTRLLAGAYRAAEEAEASQRRTRPAMKSTAGA